MKKAIQIPTERSETLKNSNERQQNRIPRYMGCLTKAYTPESISPRWPSSSKTALCDFATRYKPKPKDTIAGIKSTGAETAPKRTVEYPKIKKLNESIPQMTKNKTNITS